MGQMNIYWASEKLERPFTLEQRAVSMACEMDKS